SLSSVPTGTVQVDGFARRRTARTHPTTSIRAAVGGRGRARGRRVGGGAVLERRPRNVDCCASRRRRPPLTLLASLPAGSAGSEAGAVTREWLGQVRTRST